jgi:hypothetical protein
MCGCLVMEFKTVLRSVLLWMSSLVVVVVPAPGAGWCKGATAERPYPRDMGTPTMAPAAPNAKLAGWIAPPPPPAAKTEGEGEEEGSYTILLLPAEEGCEASVAAAVAPAGVSGFVGCFKEDFGALLCESPPPTPPTPLAAPPIPAEAVLLMLLLAPTKLSTLLSDKSPPPPASPAVPPRLLVSKARATAAAVDIMPLGSAGAVSGGKSETRPLLSYSSLEPSRPVPITAVAVAEAVAEEPAPPPPVTLAVTAVGAVV